MIRESLEGLIKINASLEHMGIIKGFGVFLIKLMPNVIIESLGYYLFITDVLLMIGSLFVTQRLLTIFGLRFLIQEILRSDILKLNLGNSESIKHIAIGLGICGVSFYLSRGQQPTLNDLSKSIPGSESLKQSFASTKSHRKRD